MKKSKMIMGFVLVVVLGIFIFVIANNKKDKTDDKTNDKVVKRTNTESSENSEDSGSPESIIEQESSAGKNEESARSSSGEKNNDEVYVYKGTFEGNEIISKYKIVSDIDDFQNISLEHPVEIPKEIPEYTYKYEYIKTQNGRELIGDAIDYSTESVDLAWKDGSENKYKDDCCYVVPAEYKGKKIRFIEFIVVDAAKEIYLEDGIQGFRGIQSENAESVYIPSTVHGRVLADGIKGNNITKIVFGDNMETVFAIPIKCCPKLEEVTLPDSIKYFEYEMFMACTGLKRVKLPSNLEYIGRDSFFNCKELEELDIPDSVNYIENSFIMCPKLTLIVGKDSYAQKYAEENNLNYRIRE